jgi:predicted nucleic acid-binding Zn ribbon protein
MIRSRSVTMQPIGQVLPRALAQIVREAPLSPGKVDFAWRSAVGTAMARVSAVRLESGVLLIDARTAQWSSAIMRSSPIILSRLQAMLGADTVRELRLRR